ncbi:MAG: sulfite exporter TauE/SafE family protein [Phycisphaerales bacterium]|nr:sulfite exporter TauE/SafE family protein [Phycisphaerales bacterium]
MDPVDMLIRVLIGLVAGVVGGLAGLGGSIIMLPALAMIYGYSLNGEEDESQTRHHVYMAAAMCVNVIVALSSTLMHTKKKAARKDVLISLIPSMTAGMAAGVIFAGESPGRWSLVAFACFIWLYCLYNIVTTIKKVPDHADDSPSPAHWKMIAVGLFVGAVSGYLGIGGGILLVPLLQISGLPLRHAIAGSAGVMWISSIIGASLKLYTLPTIHYPPPNESVHLTILDALSFAIPIGIGALVGAYAGAWVAHKIKLPHLKLIIALILAIASTRMVMG